MVTLINRGDSTITANLSHQGYCSKLGECSCRWTEVKRREQRKDGWHLSTQRLRTPSSITILPGNKSEPMPEAVLGLPEIDHAVKTHRLRIHKGG